MGQSDDAASSWIVRSLRWSQNTLLHQVLACVSIYAIWPGLLNYNYWWPWHVILATVGYLPLMAEAILIFTNDNVWSQELDRKKKYWIHGVILTIATVIIVAGTSIEIDRKRTVPHFNTAHGITGIVSMILVMVSFLLGWAAANPRLLKGVGRPIVFKFLHNFLGILGYVIGMVSIICGYYTRWFVYYTSAETRLTAAIATGFVTVWPLYGALGSCYEQFKDAIRR